MTKVHPSEDSMNVAKTVGLETVDTTMSERVEMIYQNHFFCPVDGAQWDDEWDSMCNDRCPECDAEIEPYLSVDLRDGSEVVHAQETYDKALTALVEYQDKLAKDFDKL